MVEPFRMDWIQFSSRHPDMIERTLRMSMESFQSLVAVLENDLKKDEYKGTGRGGSRKCLSSMRHLLSVYVPWRCRSGCASRSGCDS